MKVAFERPPNWAEIIKVFPHVAAPNSRVIFCYGDTICNPFHVELTRPLMLHEETHATQQVAYPHGPAAWWKAYLASVDFRLKQELPAHQREFMAMVDMGNRADRRQALSLVAQKLASPLYGKLVSKAKAKELILGDFK